MMISFIIGEIIQPFIYGLGWFIVWLLTLGKVKSTKDTFYKYPFVGIIGLYAGCALPAVIVISLRYFGFEV